MNPSRIRSALRTLDNEGVATDLTAPIWRWLSAAEIAAESAVPTEDDTRYLLPEHPPTITEHLTEGLNAVMTAGCLWQGYSYSLSPGQREWLRERFEMTPTKTVTVTELQVWLGTRHPRSMVLACDLHIPATRTRVLKQCTISNVGTFLRESAAIDAAREAREAGESTEAGVDLTPLKKKVTKTDEFNGFMKELGL